jgi:hypothetical protein
LTYCRIRSRPVTTTGSPRLRFEVWTLSASPRQQLTVKNMLSMSCHCPVWRSNRRGVQPTRNDRNDVPFCVTV